jgi:hypothetical protein
MRSGGSGETYRPSGLRVALGDTVTFPASPVHPLRFDAEPGRHESGVTRRLEREGPVAFYCEVHGGPGGLGMAGRVTVGTGNEPPRVQLIRETPHPRVGEPVAFRIAASDPERLPLRHERDLDGDGVLQAGTDAASANFTYPRPGRVTVTVRVTDDLGLMSEARESFAVETLPIAPGAARPPEAPALSVPATPAVSPPSPAVRLRAPRRIARTTLARRGVRLHLTADVGGRAALRFGSARRTVDLAAGRSRRVLLRPGRLPPGHARIVVVLIDENGGSTRLTRGVLVTR